MKKLKWLGFAAMFVLLIGAFAACAAPSDWQGKYVNTSWKDSNVNVTGGNTCNLTMVYTDQLTTPTGAPVYLQGTGLRFDASSDGKYAYLAIPDSTLSIKATVNSDKSLSHAGYTYKK